MNFSELNLDERLLKGIESCEYITCTPVQEQVIAAASDGSDLYVQSQTGTGKTAAYLIPVIQEILSKSENNGKKLLVLVPTRELAVQVEEEAKAFVSGTDLKAFSFYGGVGYEKQIAALKKGCDIIVATPGRIIDLLEGKNLTLKDAFFTVIDEADRMFDMGFYPDLRTILKELPPAEERQTMLFSATLNSYVKNLAWEYTRDAKEITIEGESIVVSEIAQELIHVSSDDKMKLLIGILKRENPASVMVFCNTKRTCEVVAKRLQHNDLKADFIIGDLPQSKRLQVLNSFKNGKTPILVATDVAARGIDVDDMEMVINFDLPNEAENYVHRIGRTARAGKSGKSYTFCSEQDVYNLPAIERYVEMSIPSKVAYPEDMEDDKSAGIYIKIDSYHDDDDYSDKRGGKRHDGEGWRDGRKEGCGGHRDRRGGGYGDHGSRRDEAKGGSEDRRDGYKSGGRDERGGRGNRHGGYSDGYKKSDFKRGGKSGHDNYRGGTKKDGYQKKAYHTKEELDQMQNLSFEERMKKYKEMYGQNVASAGEAVSDRNANGGVADKRGGSKGNGERKSADNKKRDYKDRKNSGNQKGKSRKDSYKNEKRHGKKGSGSYKGEGKKQSQDSRNVSKGNANVGSQPIAAKTSWLGRLKNFFKGKK